MMLTMIMICWTCLMMWSCSKGFERATRSFCSSETAQYPHICQGNHRHERFPLVSILLRVFLFSLSSCSISIHFLFFSPLLPSTIVLPSLPLPFSIVTLFLLPSPLSSLWLQHGSLSPWTLRATSLTWSTPFLSTATRWSPGIISIFLTLSSDCQVHVHGRKCRRSCWVCQDVPVRTDMVDVEDADICQQRHVARAEWLCEDVSQQGGEGELQSEQVVQIMCSCCHDMCWQGLSWNMDGEDFATVRDIVRERC